VGEDVLLMKASLHQYNLGFNAFLSRYRAKFIVDLVNNKNIGSIVDFGCGPGDVIDELDKTSSLISNAGKVSLIDFDESHIKQVKIRFRNKKNFDYYSLNLENNFKPSGLYDLAIMIDVIEHLKNPVKVLKNIKKILSLHGKLVIITPNAKSLHRRLGQSMGIIKNCYELGEADFEVGHVKLYDREMLLRDAKKAGYSDIKTTGILLKPFQNSRMEEFEIKYLDALYEVGKEIPDYCAEAVLVCS
jgi:2-polyprenyl-3-methyl-5-hydroxy-6-metoxy-1,4-benzoquinol methylase